MGVRQNFPKPTDFKPVPTWSEGHRWHGQAGRCQAWNPKHGRQCMQRALAGKRVCKFDGGKSPSGLAHYNFKNGDHSRYMPKNLAEAYTRALDDPDLLSLNTDIATVEALIDQSMRELESGDVASLFGQVGQLWTRLWPAVSREDREAVGRIREQLDGLIREGASKSVALAKLLDLTEQKRKLSETEAKRREKMEELVEAERVARDYRALVLAVKAVVDEPDKLLRIQTEFGRIIGIDHLQRAEPG